MPACLTLKKFAIFACVLGNEKTYWHSFLSRNTTSVFTTCQLKINKGTAAKRKWPEGHDVPWILMYCTRCFTLWLILLYNSSITNTETVKLWMVRGHVFHKQANKSYRSLRQQNKRHYMYVCIFLHECTTMKLRKENLHNGHSVRFVGAIISRELISMEHTEHMDKTMNVTNIVVR
jgi:hypothetical protein